MKLTKKLLPALGMLALSASMLVTSTFAWFSMNTNVTADGMSITAQADQVYLQINTDASAFKSTEQQIKATATKDGAGTKFVPITVGSGLSADEKTLTPLSAANGLLESDTIKWYTNTSNSPASHAAANKYGTVAEPSSTQALQNTFYLRLNPTAGLVETTSELVCDVALTQIPASDEMYKSVSVLVVCGDYAQLWQDPGTDKKFATCTGDQLTSGGFKNTSDKKENEKNAGPVEVQVYVFFDGEDESCKTNNVTTNGYGVEISFSLKANTNNNG